MRKRFMMYIAADVDRSGRFCAGSCECISLIQANPLLMRTTRIENVDVIRHENPTLPPWLYGTPTLVDTHLKRIMRGTSARDYLMGIVVETVPDPVESLSKASSVYTAAGHAVNPVFHENAVRDTPHTVEEGDSKRISEIEMIRHIQERDILTAKLMHSRE